MTKLDYMMQIIGQELLRL